MIFTHSLAQIQPNEFLSIVGFNGGLTYNKQPQYTSYNGDLYTTIGVVPTFILSTNDRLYYDYFGEKNINLVDANNFTDFKFIFDVWQLDQDIPNLQDIVGYRYNQYEMYGINAYLAGKKKKNLGRYIVPPNPKTGLGSLNISKVIRAHEKYNNIVEDIRDVLNLSKYDNTWYVPDTTNTCKWNIEYGFEVNPGLTFSDTFFTPGVYVNPVTGTTASYELGFTFSTPHYLKYGDELIIEMNDLSLNIEYNGLCYVVDVVNPFHIVVDKLFGQSSTNEGGTITYLLRTNEIQSGNWWKYFGSQNQGLSYSVDFSSEYSSGLGFMNGRQTTNFSINSTTQRYINKLGNNFGQVGGGIIQDSILLQKNVINDTSGLLINKALFPNQRYGSVSLGITASDVNMIRFFMTNWDDTTMGRKDLNFYTWTNGQTTEMFYPDYTLGALTHQNYWPAYWRNFSTSSVPTTFGDKLSTVPTFNCLRYILKSADGSIRATYTRDLTVSTVDDFNLNENNWPLIPVPGGNNIGIYIKDFEKHEFILSNNQVFQQFGLNPDDGDIYEVQLVKRYVDGWTFSDFSGIISDDFNVIMDFDGVDYDLDVNFNDAEQISPYPFHYQFTDYYGDCSSNRAVFRGPFGSRQNIASSVAPWDPENYNFKFTSATVSYVDAQWPYDLLTVTQSNKGYWTSEMEFVQNDPNCNEPTEIFIKTFNELYIDSDLSTFNRSTLPEGTYSFDYIISTSTNVLSFIWKIGNESTLLNTSVGIYRGSSILHTGGGQMSFEAQIDPAGTLVVLPLKIRHLSDLVMAKKEFNCNVICRGKNPYTIPLGKWDYGQKVELMFLNRLGSYERLYFDYDSTKTVSIEKTTYNKSFERDKWGMYNNDSHQKDIFSVMAREQYLLNSDWIKQNKLSFYEELMTSPKVYIVDYVVSDDGSNFTPSVYNTSFIPVNILDTRFTQKTYLRDKLFNLQLTIELAFDTNLQNQ